MNRKDQPIELRPGDMVYGAFESIVKKPDIDRIRAERDAEWVAEIDRMLRVTDDHSEYGLTEHERGYKNALLYLKARMTGETAGGE